MRDGFAKWELKNSVFPKGKPQAGNCWVTASLLAEATIPGDQAEPGKKGAPIGPIPHDAPRRNGG
jgi:hypothetical protein